MRSRERADRFALRRAGQRCRLRERGCERDNPCEHVEPPERNGFSRLTVLTRGALGGRGSRGRRTLSSVSGWEAKEKRRAAKRDQRADLYPIHGGSLRAQPPRP